MQRTALLPFVALMEGRWGQAESRSSVLQTVGEFSTRREAVIHFAMLVALRYNRKVLLDLIGNRGMMPLEQLKNHSGFYESILKKGRDEGRRQTTLDFICFFGNAACPQFVLGN